MCCLRTLIFLSTLAVPALAHAEDADATSSHSVAPKPHTEAVTSHPPPPTPTDSAPALSTDPTQSAPIDTATAPRRWYGWQTLVIDGAAATVVIAGLSISTQTGDAGQIMAYGAAGAYLVGAPITHLAHGHSGRALGSLALRAALPAGVALLGSQGPCGRMDELCSLGGAALGAVAAVAIDATLLGYERVPVQRRGLTTLGVSIDGEHAAIVAGGTF